MGIRGFFAFTEDSKRVFGMASTKLLLLVVCLAVAMATVAVEGHPFWPKYKRSLVKKSVAVEGPPFWPKYKRSLVDAVVSELAKRGPDCWKINYESGAFDYVC